MDESAPNRMVRAEYAELDIGGWTVAGDEEQGTKPKHWLLNPSTGDYWLMKYTTFAASKDGSRYRKGDDWAERIACGVAEALGIPAAPVELAWRPVEKQRVYGTVCRSVLRGEEVLVNGDELIAALGISVSRRWRDLYTVETVLQALENLHPPPTADMGLTAGDVFVGYLVLDALIGNTDRHEENWGGIKPHSTVPPRWLSPTFDHASSLGFQLNDQQKQERLRTRDQNRTPEGWADRAKTRFAGSPHPITVVNQVRDLGGHAAVEHWLGRIQQPENLVAAIWAVPKHRMSNVSKEFAERMLLHNWSRLNS